MSTNDKKNLILKSAYELFSENGFHSTKMIDIAKNAGIGKGTIYEYFSSKDELFIEFIKEKLLNCYMNIDHIFSEHLTASEKIETFISYESSKIIASGKIFNFQTELKEFKNPKIHNIFFEVQLLRFNIVKKIIKEGIENKEFKNIDVNAAAMTVMGSITAFLISRHELHPSSHKLIFEKPIEIKTLLDLLLNGLLL